jgi:hypothetical protein
MAQDHQNQLTAYYERPVCGGEFEKANARSWPI